MPADAYGSRSHAEPAADLLGVELVPVGQLEECPIVGRQRSEGALDTRTFFGRDEPRQRAFVAVFAASRTEPLECALLAARRPGPVHAEAQRRLKHVAADGRRISDPAVAERLERTRDCLLRDVLGGRPLANVACGEYPKPGSVRLELRGFAVGILEGRFHRGVRPLPHRSLILVQQARTRLTGRGNMIRNKVRHLAILSVLLAAPATLRAGVNTWTGSSPTGAPEASLVAGHPGDPYLVYGAFGPELHRSRDGGRTWSLVQSFGSIRALFVHPASPSTIYVADDADVFQTSDGGATWKPVIWGGYVTALAGDPNDASTVFAGGWWGIFRTTDGGATWSSADLATSIASLVIDPRNPSTAYAGTEADGWYFNYGYFLKTTDGGSNWEDLTPQQLGAVSAVVLDPVASSTLYMATTPDVYGHEAPGVMRSDDYGASWTPASKGLPEIVLCLVADPRVSGMLYAGTSSGIYRTRDGGQSWTPFGQRLAGDWISQLSIDDSGRHLHAGTFNGVYDIEIAEGPLDVAAGPAGVSRLLSRNADRAAVGALDASGRWMAGASSDPSAIWTATAMASGGSDRAHILWQSGDGRSGLEIVGPSGREFSTVFTTMPGWIASDLSVRADGRTSVLWTGEGGRTRIATVDTSGGATFGPEYGPAIGWSAVAIADDSGGHSWILWRSADGRSGISLHREGVMLSSFLWLADPDWSVEDVAVGADDRARLLRTAPDGTAEVSIVDATGQRTSAASFGSPGLKPRRISAGADGLTRLLFGGKDGSGEVVVLGSDNTLSARHPIPEAVAANPAEFFSSEQTSRTYGAMTR